MRNILVYVEAAEGKAKNVGLEILTPAKVAAEGGEVSPLLSVKTLQRLLSRQSHSALIRL